MAGTRAAAAQQEVLLALAVGRELPVVLTCPLQLRCQDDVGWRMHATWSLLCDLHAGQMMGRSRQWLCALPSDSATACPSTGSSGLTQAPLCRVKQSLQGLKLLSFNILNVHSS